MDFPEVRYLILCDEVRTNARNVLKVEVVGLITHIRSKKVPAFPVVHPEFRVLVILTNCRGTGQISIRIIQERTRRVVFRSRPKAVQFKGKSTEAVGIVYRVTNCSFPEEGLYWVEVVFSEKTLARQALTITGRV